MTSSNKCLVCQLLSEYKLYGYAAKNKLSLQKLHRKERCERLFRRICKWQLSDLTDSTSSGLVEACDLEHAKITVLFINKYRELVTYHQEVHCKKIIRLQEQLSLAAGNFIFQTRHGKKLDILTAQREYERAAKALERTRAKRTAVPAKSLDFNALEQLLAQVGIAQAQLPIIKDTHGQRS